MVKKVVVMTAVMAVVMVIAAVMDAVMVVNDASDGGAGGECWRWWRCANGCADGGGCSDGGE